MLSKKSRGGVLDETFWSPWPWPQSLQVWKIPWPRPRTALFFESLKMDHCHNFFFFILEIAGNLAEIYDDLFFWKMPEISRKICDLFGRRPFFGKNLRSVSLVLGLEHSCPWLRKGLSSESQSLNLASDFFAFLVLATSLVSLTPPPLKSIIQLKNIFTKIEEEVS